MPQVIRIARLPLPMRMGWVNPYLLRAADGFVLVDTGGANARRALLRALGEAGCGPGSLRLVLLTHGDLDHTGSAAYLRVAFGAPVAMHREDAAMGERGDMFANRKRPNALVRALVPLLTGFGKPERFTPDLCVDEGKDLSRYGLEATVLWLPGHSRGSIGVLTAGGALFCGDLLENTKGPALNSLMDDRAAGQASVERLRTMAIRMIYPGHGDPFGMEALARARRTAFAKARGFR